MKKDVLIAAVAAIVIIAVAFGLAMARPDLPLTPSNPFSSKAEGSKAPDAKAAAASTKVVMHINGEPVTEAEFNEFVQLAPEQSRGFYASPEGRRTLAEELVKLKALEQEGRKLGVADEPATATQIRMSEAQIIAGVALRKLVGEPNDADLRKQYESQRANFETAELSHILIAYQGGMVPARRGQAPSPEAAMQRAQQIRTQLGSGDFANAARQVSDDTQTAANGGSLGSVPIGALPPEVQPTIGALNPGEVSAPVRTQMGIHLFKMGKRDSRPFEEVKAQLAERVQQQKAQETVARIEKTAKVDYDETFFPKPAPASPNAPPVPNPAQPQN